MDDGIDENDMAPFVYNMGHTKAPLACVNEENSINEQSARGHSGIKSGRKAPPQSIFTVN